VFLTGSILNVVTVLLGLKTVRLATFLPALLLAPVFIRLANVVRSWLA
jgi:uncharacterized membrane protein YqgA involved in biofilm formation